MPGSVPLYGDYLWIPEKAITPSLNFRLKPKGYSLSYLFHKCKKKKSTFTWSHANSEETYKTSLNYQNFSRRIWALAGELNSPSVQSLSHVWLSATSSTVVRQASLSITNSQRLHKLMSIKLVMPSNHLILFCPLLLLPSIIPSTRVFSNESVLQIRWPKYWSFKLQQQSFRCMFRTDSL